jgi:hypothetical protein
MVFLMRLLIFKQTRSTSYFYTKRAHSMNNINFLKIDISLVWTVYTSIYTYYLSVLTVSVFMQTQPAPSQLYQHLHLLRPTVAAFIYTSRCVQLCQHLHLSKLYQYLRRLPKCPGWISIYNYILLKLS